MNDLVSAHTQIRIQKNLSKQEDEPIKDKESDNVEPEEVVDKQVYRVLNKGDYFW